MEDKKMSFFGWIPKDGIFSVYQTILYIKQKNNLTIEET
jgi:hypothetical protein